MELGRLTLHIHLVFNLAADSPNQQIFFIKGVTLDNNTALNPIPTVFDSFNSTGINSTGLMTLNIVANRTNSSTPVCYRIYSKLYRRRGTIFVQLEFR